MIVANLISWVMLIVILIAVVGCFRTIREGGRDVSVKIRRRRVDNSRR